MKLRKLVLDGKKIKSEEDMHKFIANCLEFPDYYGMNLDALWDMLTAWVEYPLIIEWKNFDASEIFLGQENALKILKLFQEAEQEIDGLTVKSR